MPAMARPRVGVVDQGKEEKLRPYVDAIRDAGADVTVLRWTTPEQAERDARSFDALVLCGGDDVDARNWGETTHAACRLVPPERDAYEIALVRAAARDGVPVLGVCRGCQVMNVALGGTLEQHIPDVPGRVEHREGTSHGVELLPDTRLARVAAGGTVNSYHHQAVGRVAPPLRVAARSEDGGVEAVEGEGAFFVGVQWHPERTGNGPGLGRELFSALVEAARKRGTSAPRRSSEE